MQQHGELIARETRAFGFNTTLAPVLDLALPASASVMGTRAAATEPEAIVHYTRAFLNGLAKHGVVGCGKHFPGLGGGTLDSHLATPEINRTWRELWTEDLMPYRELARELPMVMITHAAYPNTRSGKRPATAAPFWPTTVLQRQIGYKGLIFSDDLEMGGILKFAPMEEAAILALRAGIHILEICHSPELILRCYESLVREGERSASFRKILLERASDGTRLRKARFSQPPSRPLTARQLDDLRDRIFSFGDTIEKKVKVPSI
jgi:beta-N-acetylhexosaminidase